MLYEYLCPECDIVQDIVKSTQHYASREFCVVCNAEMMKIFRSVNVAFRKTSWPEFNPAFGKVINNNHHRSEEAKKRDWVEVGNENMGNISQKLQSEREQKLERSWADTHVEGIC